MSTSQPPTQPTLLQVEQLSVERGQRQLLQQLSLRIRGGEIWAVLGENGSGKSSLLHCLAGLLAPSAGTIQIRDKALPGWRRKDLARELGLLLQQSQDGFPLSVRAAVAAGRYPYQDFWAGLGAEDWQRVQDALTQVGLQQHSERLLQDLSGGERQRVAIATLLAQDPAIFLLDEPCNHLDIRHQIRLLDHFRHLARCGRAVIMALHDLNLATRYCQQVILLMPSGEVKVGAARELLTERYLSELFLHPMREVSDGRCQLWVPE